MAVVLSHRKTST